MMKNLLVCVVLLCASWTFITPVYAGSNGSLSLDGIYSKRLSGVIGHENGLGGSILLEWQPVESFSIGVGADTLLYFGVQTPGISAIESVNLVSRYIINPGEDWTFYMMVGGGLNPKLDLKADFLWGGDFHLMGGPGAWCFLSPQVAINMGLVFDYYNNTAPVDPLNALNFRAGLSFFFENTKKQTSPAAQETPTPQAAVTTQTVTDLSPEDSAKGEATPISSVATPVVQAVSSEVKAEIATPALSSSNGPVAKAEAVASTVKAKVATPALSTSNGPVSKVEAVAPTAKAEAETAPLEMTPILSFKGDSLWDTAARTDVYGDPELYPLLVDANKANLKPKQFVLDADTKLNVPKDPTQDMINQARKNAWTAKYQQFSGRRLSPEGYQKWRATHGLSTTP